MPADALLQKLDTLPSQPGCYLFKDKKGAVVYVGKAKSLRSRVRSYFQASTGDERYFVPLLQRTAADLETIVTASEKEAAILEDSLIKQYQPRYNVKLRDDKSYLSLRIDESHAWPRVDIVRRPSADGARYFGPYHSATAARRTLHLVNKHFQLRTCTDPEFAARKRPCLQFQIRRCLAPCVYEVDPAWYRDQVRAVELFLDGRHDELSEELDGRMRGASRALEFELAATYRDQLRAVDAIRQEQRVVAVKDVDQDVIGLYREADLGQIAVVFIRRGRVVDTATFPLRGVEIPDAEVIGAFLAQYYAGTPGDVIIPDEVIVPVLPELAEGVGEWLSELRKKRCQVIYPQRGPRVDLLALANENAAHAFREQRRAADDVEERLAQLQKRLRLPTLPRRIECIDISHLGGGDTVGAVVALADGQPDKKKYRTFHVKGITPGDDYGAMYQVLARRFRRGKAAAEQAERAASESTPESEADAEQMRDRIDWDLPDLFVVDGGRGQLNVALTAARDLGLHELPIVGLAKERSAPTLADRGGRRFLASEEGAETAAEEPKAEGETAAEDGGEHEADDAPEAAPKASEPATPERKPNPDNLVDRVYLPGQKNGIPLHPNSAPLFFLARARDEAHRFSNRARERLGKTRRFRSELDDIPGIGPATRKALLRALGTVEAVRKATDEQLLAVPGVTRRSVQALRKRYPLS
jgi:excinuclease ABC subunit C